MGADVRLHPKLGTAPHLQVLLRLVYVSCVAESASVVTIHAELFRGSCANKFACSSFLNPLSDLGANRLGLPGGETEGAPGSALVVFTSPVSAHDAGG